MQQKDALTYLDFINNFHCLKNDVDIEQIFSLLKHLQNFPQAISFWEEHAFFIIDYAKQSHILISESVSSIIGYKPMDFLSGGLEFVVSILQKDDFIIFNKNYFPAVINFLSSQPQKEHSTYSFETNYRIHINGNKNITHILQKSSYITDPITNLPLYCFGACINISSFKKDSRIVQVIKKNNPVSKGQSYQHISTDHYYPQPEEAILTKREKEILKWIADGLSSKQIADKFNLSNNTVMNHRVNMLRKTNTKNVAELIKYAIMNGII